MGTPRTENLEAGKAVLDSSALVRVLGFPATLVHGDPLVLDRWRWLRERLPLTANGDTLLDVGCGTGAFTIGAARRGYRATGISWDERNQQVADARARMCGAATASFVTGDVRQLDSLDGLDAQYDVAICLECVEHVLDDRKLLRDITARLKPGGRLLLTTPNFYYVPISAGDRGPFLTEETGWHVRRGYTRSMLTELCELSGLRGAEITYCGGYLSQKATKLWRAAHTVTENTVIHWVITAPARLAAAALPDRKVTALLGWPFFSICLEAHKPRFDAATRASEERASRPLGVIHRAGTRT